MSDVPLADLGGGVAVPMVGFGTWQLSGRRAYESVRYALEVGYRHVDTATMYRNEREVGQAIRDSGLGRGKVFVTTKLPPSDAGRARASLDASLRALDTDYVDLWLVHWPPRRQALVPLWREFVALRDEGGCRAVGVSNYGLAQIDEVIQATQERPAVNQIRWSPARHDPALLAAHADRGVAVEGYSPLNGNRLRDPVLAELAARHRVTPAQVVLRWHLEHGIIVIPRSSQPAHIASNFDLFSFSLTPEETARLDGKGALSGNGLPMATGCPQEGMVRPSYPQLRSRPGGSGRVTATVEGPAASGRRASQGGSR
jgi:2,5-diketo-D-gluconate reductase A